MFCYSCMYHVMGAFFFFYLDSHMVISTKAILRMNYILGEKYSLFFLFFFPFCPRQVISLSISEDSAKQQSQME